LLIYPLHPRRGAFAPLLHLEAELRSATTIHAEGFPRRMKELSEKFPVYSVPPMEM